MGHKVRLDTGHKKNSYLTAVLSDHLNFVHYCPEIEIGLGTPREPIRLVEIDSEILCVDSKQGVMDITDKLYDIAEKQRHWQSDLCGYILKKDSTSCSMERVRVYSNDMPERKGDGLYAERLLANNPCLPVEEEGRLENAHLRENFFKRVFIYARWKELTSTSLTVSRLQNFHATHKYIFMSHNQKQAVELGVLLANISKGDLESVTSKYLTKMMSLLKIIATKGNHVNTLKHIQGYLKNHLDASDKEELVDVIENYRLGQLPLIVPITLLRHYFRRHPNDYINQSFYLNPHPGELMLFNSI